MFVHLWSPLRGARARRGGASRLATGHPGRDDANPCRAAPMSRRRHTMKTLPEELLDLLWGGHNVWVATVAPDGTPNVSIKGSGALLDDGHLYFADMFSHKTRENIQHDPRVAVDIHDPERSRHAGQGPRRAHRPRRGVRPVDEKLRKLCEQAHLPPVKYVVKIDVESVWDMGPGPHAGQELPRAQCDERHTNVRTRPSARRRRAASGGGRRRASSGKMTARRWRAKGPPDRRPPCSTSSPSQSAAQAARERPHPRARQGARSRAGRRPLGRRGRTSTSSSSAGARRTSPPTSPRRSRSTRARHPRVLRRHPPRGGRAPEQARRVHRRSARSA